MNAHAFTFCGEPLQALGSGALFWPREALLVVSDLHLGKSERIARKGGPTLPPYETQDTLQRLADALDTTKATTVICLGDSFDDDAAGKALSDTARATLSRLKAGRRWIWITGNHDPGPLDLGGEHRAETTIGPLTFRHIADAKPQAEVSGHYHPKARLRTRAGTVSRPCFLYDEIRLILPAFGTYTGGLWSSDPALAFMGAKALAILTGPQPLAIPMPR